SDLALKAAMKLLVDADLNDIDFLIFSSLTLDYHAPSTASILHKKLGLKASCGVMDLPLGCAGFPMALMMANGLFNTMNLNRVLVLLGEVPTRAVHPANTSINYAFLVMLVRRLCWVNQWISCVLNLEMMGMVFRASMC
ncbi:MAG: 3-oxoacyl-[acyl-carrier-protein] synthase 3, partial [Bacteroidota bacterium]